MQIEKSLNCKLRNLSISLDEETSEPKEGMAYESTYIKFKNRKH